MAAETNIDLNKGILMRELFNLLGMKKNQKISGDNI